MGNKVNGNDPLGWDESLRENMKDHWSQWRDVLPRLEEVLIPCCHHSKGFDTVTWREIHAFSGASKEAIRAALYLCEFNKDGVVSLSILFGWS